MINLLFYLGLALLFTHELDAIKCKEWEIFPVLKNLNDEYGYRWFLLLHIPLFMVIFWLLQHPDPMVQRWFQIGVDGFLIAHLGLHIVYRNGPKNR